MQEPATANSSISRALQMALAAVIALALVGFVVGIRQGTSPPNLTPPPRVPPASHPDAIVATAYRDFDRRVFGPNRNWHNSLASLPQPPDDLTADVQRDRELLEVVLAARASRRAFDGAPPVVPHPIDQMSTSSCMACHGEGIWIGKGVRAPKMSHAFYQNCTQCHVEQQASELPAMASVECLFQGQTAPQGGHRAWPGAPPVVPHSIWMREKCLSCHGPGDASPMRTTHPDRANCLQCHAPSAVLDQWADDDAAPWPAASAAEANGGGGGGEP